MVRDTQFDNDYSGDVSSCLAGQTQQCDVCKDELVCSEDSLETCGEAPAVLFRALKVGRLRGIVGIAGCRNVTSGNYPSHVHLVRELTQRDILVVVSGYISSDILEAGLMDADCLESAGEGLKEFCGYLDVGSVLYTGSWSADSRISDFIAELADHAGVDGKDLPLAVVRMESYLDKELDEAAYDILSTGDEDPVKAADLVDAHIHRKRLGVDWCDQFHCSIHS